MEFVFQTPTTEGPEPGRIYDLLIVGGGPAGLTAALYGARAGLSTALLEKGAPGGLMATTERVENCPGCVEGSGADIAKQFLQQATKFGAKFGAAEVSELRLAASPKRIVAANGVYLAHAVIIATGSRPRQLNVPGEQEYWGKGVSFCSTCDGPFYQGKRVAVVGGGNSALQEAEFLLRYVSHLTFLQDLDYLTASQVLQDRMLSHPNVKLIYGTSIRKIVGNGGVRAVEIEDRHSGQRSEVPVDGVFIFVGLIPNSDLVNGQLDLDEQSNIRTNARLETSIPGVYAAGDIRRGATKQIVTAAADGATAALSAIEWLRSKHTSSASSALAGRVVGREA
jgi:thioredoxin reductase (NADPH)